MRRLTILVLSGLFFLGLAGSATAVSLAVDPPTPPGKDFTTGDGQGVVAIRDVDPEGIMFQLVEVSGQEIAGVKVLVANANGAPRLPNKVGTHFGNGVNVIDGWIEDGRFPASKAVFVFQQPFDRMASDLMTIGFADSLQVGDTIFFSLFDGNNQLIPGATDLAISIVPEPGTALLLGIGMSGLAVAGRRRR